MIWVGVVAAFACGVAIGAAIVLIMKRHSEEDNQARLDAIKSEMSDSFGRMSLDSLSPLTEEFARLATEKLENERKLNTSELEGKKGLIDQQLEHMSSELKNVARLMQDLEKDRVQKFGELSSSLKHSVEQTAALTETTNMLREALASTRVRGQWGEKMAEDVLRLAGFKENINYLKQKQIDEVGSRPDYTFFLPNDLKLNMDVKFPLDNYVRFLNADSEREGEECSRKFLGDVRSRIKEVTTRDYINPQQNTVDCVLLFIPNEQIYTFVYENDNSIFDEGIKNRVLLCSPITLIAILAVIRQAVDYFTLEQTSTEILSWLGKFNLEWGKFIKTMDTVGQRLESAQRSYEELAGTRRRQLEKPLGRIEQLREQSGLPIAVDEESELPQPDIVALEEKSES